MLIPRAPKPFGKAVPNGRLAASLETVAAEILRLDPDGSRTAQVLRQTFDQLYDGERMGRYRWDQLHNAEKKHCGPII